MCADLKPKLPVPCPRLGCGYGDHMSQIVFNSKTTIWFPPGHMYCGGRGPENIVPEIKRHLPLSIRVILGLTQGLGAP